MLLNTKNTKSGFTLLEILIVISLLAMIFLTIVYASTLSIKNNIINQHKIIATHYGEDMVEWLRSEKDATFSGFLSDSQMDINNSLTYCFNDDQLFWTSISSAPPLPTPQVFQNQCSTNYSLNNIYQRQLIMTKITGGAGDTQIQSQIQVSWKEGINTFTTTLNTILGQYD